ncbi:hypothetical protein [Deinococcus sp.]|uniref:glycine-rich domain-containing protein n=1 Tax=Deinococcus sp. TaxID=47478 RepID=UPI0025FAADD7|nr:hypothetical protein [Deinococcus sp.]
MTQLSLLKPARQPSIPGATPEAQLLAYEFPAAFAGRLAKEHGWTLAFAEDVLREYRRFLVLAATSGQSVTPSQTVDAAWHEHLTHTRDYWLNLTPLLPAPLHHEPGEGKPGEATRFAAQYQNTLELYRERFGEPDSRIWPDPSRTPGRVAGRRGGSAQFWVLFGIAALGLLLATLVKPWVGFGLVVALLLLAYLLTRPRRRRSSRSGSGSGGDGGDAGLFFLGFLGGDASDAGASGHDGGGHSGDSDGGNSDGGSSCGSSCGS